MRVRDHTSTVHYNSQSFIRNSQHPFGYNSSQKLVSQHCGIIISAVEVGTGVNSSAPSGSTLLCVCWRKTRESKRQSRGNGANYPLLSGRVIQLPIATSNSVKPHLLISCRSFLNGLVVELLIMADPAVSMVNLSELIAPEENIPRNGLLGVDNTSPSSAGIIMKNPNKSRFVVIRQSNGASTDPPLPHQSEGECVYVIALTCSSHQQMDLGDRFVERFYFPNDAFSYLFCAFMNLK